MDSITVRLDESASTFSQYENRTDGVLHEDSNLERHSQEGVMAKTPEFVALAKQSVDGRSRNQ